METVKTLKSSLTYLILSVAFLGCTFCTKGRGDLASLPRPLFVFGNPVNVYCTDSTAVDAQGQIWTESECEGRSSGIQSRRRLNPAQKRRFDEAVSALKRMSMNPTTTRCRSSFADFTIHENDGSNRHWFVCLPEKGMKWPNPFGEIFAALEYDFVECASGAKADCFGARKGRQFSGGPTSPN